MMASAETTGYHYKLRNLIRKGMRGAFSEERVITVFTPDEHTKLSPDAQEANIAVSITALPIKKGSAHSDGEQLQQLHEHMMQALDDSGLAQHVDASMGHNGKYAGIEVTSRRGVTTLTMYASDPETIEQLLTAGMDRMRKEKIDDAFRTFRRF